MGWMRALDSSAIADGEMVGVTISDHDVLVAKVDGEFFAIGNICSHAWGLLDQGKLVGCEVECPLHVGRFDLRTGDPTRRPAKEPVPNYQIRVDEGGVLIYVEES